MHHQRFVALQGGGEAGRSHAADLLGVIAQSGRVQGGGQPQVVRLEAPRAREPAPLGQQGRHGFTSVRPGVFIIKGSQVLL